MQAQFFVKQMMLNNADLMIKEKEEEYGKATLNEYRMR